MMIFYKRLQTNFVNQLCTIKKIVYSNAVKKTFKQDQPKQSGIIIKNDNLKFQTSDYFVHVFPFHPQIIKKNVSTFQINKYSIVLALTFVKKQEGLSYDNMLQANNQKEKSASNPWNQRKSISFKFTQLSKLTFVTPLSGKQCTLERKKFISAGSQQKASTKKLLIKDLKEENKIGLKLNEIEYAQNNQQNKLWEIKTKMPYEQFEIMTYLIKESLFDLSGLKIMFDFKRNQELAKLNKKSQHDKDLNDLVNGYQTKKEQDKIV